MKKQQEITALCEDVMLDISGKRLPLGNILLKASRISRILDNAESTKWFIENAKLAESHEFIISSFETSIQSAQDRDVAVSSSNPSQYVHTFGNTIERNNIRKQATASIASLSHLRGATYDWVSSIYAKWQFGNIAQSIFELKRSRAEPILQKIFPDINERLNSIEQNIQSSNPEDWKNAVSSCRTLFMDLADILNPPRDDSEKPKYINRLKDFVSPKTDSKTKKSLLQASLEELKNRMEWIIDLTQGSSHQVRPHKTDCENVVLQTYLMVADLIELYSVAQKIDPKPNDTPAQLGKKSEISTKDD